MEEDDRRGRTFLSHTFLQTPVTRKTPDLVIHHLELVPVIRRGQLLGRDGHTDGVSDALTEGAGGNLDTCSFPYQSRCKKQRGG